MSFLFAMKKLDDDDEKGHGKNHHHDNVKWTYTDMTGKTIHIKLVPATLAIQVNGVKAHTKTKSSPERIEMTFEVGEDKFSIVGVKRRHSHEMSFSLTVNDSDAGVVELGEL